MIKKFTTFFLVLLIIASCLCVNSFAFANTMVDDSADLLSETEEASIGEILLDFSQETDYSAVVLTTNDATGKTSQQYADDYFDDLIISSGWEEKGILFLIDMDNREVCISTMGDCIYVYGDSIDYIIDCGFDDLVNGNYYGCFNLMISCALKCALIESGEQYSGNNDAFCGDYSVNSGGYLEEEYYDSSSDSVDVSNIFLCIVIAAVIGFVSVLIVKSSYKNMGKGDEFDADDLILNLTGSNDTVISRNVITTKVPRNNSNHRPGGPSGGSFSHRSSGGFNHGGGSRKF